MIQNHLQIVSCKIDANQGHVLYQMFHQSKIPLIRRIHAAVPDTLYKISIIIGLRMVTPNTADGAYGIPFAIKIECYLEIHHQIVPQSTTFHFFDQSRFHLIAHQH